MVKISNMYKCEAAAPKKLTKKPLKLSIIENFPRRPRYRDDPQINRSLPFQDNLSGELDKASCDKMRRPEAVLKSSNSLLMLRGSECVNNVGNSAQGSLQLFTSFCKGLGRNSGILHRDKLVHEKSEKQNVKVTNKENNSRTYTLNPVNTYYQKREIRNTCKKSEVHYSPQKSHSHVKNASSLIKSPYENGKNFSTKKPKLFDVCEGNNSLSALTNLIDNLMMNKTRPRNKHDAAKPALAKKSLPSPNKIKDTRETKASKNCEVREKRSSTSVKALTNGFLERFNLSKATSWRAEYRTDISTNYVDRRRKDGRNQPRKSLKQMEYKKQVEFRNKHDSVSVDVTARYTPGRCTRSVRILRRHHSPVAAIIAEMKALTGQGETSEKCRSIDAPTTYRLRSLEQGTRQESKLKHVRFGLTESISNNGNFKHRKPSPNKQEGSPKLVESHTTDLQVYSPKAQNKKYKRKQGPDLKPEKLLRSKRKRDTTEAKLSKKEKPQRQQPSWKCYLRPFKKPRSEALKSNLSDSLEKILEDFKCDEDPTLTFIGPPGDGASNNGGLATSGHRALGSPHGLAHESYEKKTEDPSTKLVDTKYQSLPSGTEWAQSEELEDPDDLFCCSPNEVTEEPPDVLGQGLFWDILEDGF